MNDSPRDRYHQHKASAKKRGIEFDLTFDEWWEIWSAHFEKRGVGSGDMQMCRTRDEDAYRLGNVRIDTGLSNRKEACLVRLNNDLKEAWGAEPDRARWIHHRGRSHMDYFTMREYAEENPEDGEDE